MLEDIRRQDEIERLVAQSFTESGLVVEIAGRHLVVPPPRRALDGFGIYVQANQSLDPIAQV